MTQEAQAPLIAISNHDPVLMRLLDGALTKQGFRSMILPQGSTAYEVIKKNKPDLIMLDVGAGAPEDSWVLFQVLRLDEETIHIPVLIASSDPTQFEKTALGLEQHSGVDVIDKPYDRQLLYERITDLLKRE
jgi:DNA-binding response OmpR family regulator